MYDLHIANKNYSSWSLRPWLLMKELDIPFQEYLHPFGKVDDWENYKKLNASGLVPALVTGDELIWDSLAIMEFLAERHSGVWPEDSSARAWARCATAEMHSGFSELRTICSMNCGLRVKLKEMSPKLDNDLTRIDLLWKTGLEKFGGPFLAGSNFSAVDAFYAPVVFRIQTFGLKLGADSENYMQQILSLDSMKSWYQDALQEPFRDVEHEEEILQYGSVESDFRTS